MAVTSLPVAPSEAEFQAQVLELAEYSGWTLRYHTHDSRHSARGFPDLVLVRAPEIIFAELKGARTPITPPQFEWLEALTSCGLEAYLWRPQDWGDVVARLTRRRRPRTVA